MGKKVLLTGGTGYIGSWVARLLLEKGYVVRLAVRDKTNEGRYRHLLELESQLPGRLEIYQADLLEEGTYDEPAAGSEAIIHVASPFTFRIRDARSELLNPAVKGTENVLRAASRSATVKKIVLTSSVAAVHGDNIDMQERGLKEFTEAHFNETSSLTHQPYSYSKVEAEKRAWEMYREQDLWQLVVVNPSFVVGPPLSTGTITESLQFVKDMLSGKFSLGAPDLRFGFVDVRDVARAHILALENDQAEGRHILAERVMSVLEMAAILRNLYGSRYKLPHSQTPKFMLYLVGSFFGLTRKFVARNVGHPLRLNAGKSREALGLTYTPMEQSLADMVEQMKRLGLI